jgi:CDP-glycerol glycerophosphotransferase (TagB/SpsB family)
MKSIEIIGDDKTQRMIQLKHSSPSRTSEVRVLTNGIKSNLFFEKFNDAPTLKNPQKVIHWFWIKVLPGEAFSISVNGKSRLINFKGIPLGWRVTERQLCKALQWKLRRQLFSAFASGHLLELRRVNRARPSGGTQATWLFCDRDDKADDNAEHLYRFVRNNDPEKKIFFVLREETSDYRRLKQEGFNLVAFGSEKHRELLFAADVAIYSNLKPAITWPFSGKKGRSIAKKLKHRTVFLQHGVTKEDVSRVYNSRKVDLFVTATQPEFNSIAGEGSPYKYSTRDTKLTGFPRWDALVRRPQTHSTILVMPTWRKYIGFANGTLTDKILAHPNRFFAAWQELLASDTLQTLAERHGMKIVFAPHPNLVSYFNDLGIDGKQKTRVQFTFHDQFKDGQLQPLFADAAVLLTDYSSVAFDLAYIGKRVVYYQFDKDLYDATHVKPGYYDYLEDGFGPVCLTIKDVELALEDVLLNRNTAEYDRRIAHIFPYRDDKNCPRTYTEILRMLGEASRE